MLNLLLLTNRADEIAFLKPRLSRQGYRVMVFDRHLESLDSFLERIGPIDAAFLPSRDSTFIRELRGNPWALETPIICFLTSPDPLPADDPALRGCDLIINRPSTQGELLQSLVDVLHARGKLA